MNRMWKNIMLPIIKFKNIKYIVEIGADKGINTNNILNYCIENDAKLVSIDPKPDFDVNFLKNEYGHKFTFFENLSLEILPELDNTFDCVLIDGDHNWYTVFNELICISKKFHQDNFPLIFLHDVSWPYGRRDLYYNPINIPSEYLNDYSKLGMHPDHEDLLPQYGLNTNLFNANKENTPKNGVLTAVEDFIDCCNLDLEYHHIPIFFGLGVLHKKDNELYDFIEKTVFNNEILGFVDLFYIRSDINKSIMFLKKIKSYSELSEVNVQKDNEIIRLTQEVDKTLKNLSELEEELSNANFNSSLLSEKNLNLINENSIQKHRIEDLKSEISNLLFEFNFKNDIINSISKSNVQLTNSNEIQLKKIDELKNEISYLNDSIAIFKENNNNLTSISNKQQSEIKNLNVQLNESNYKLNVSESELIRIKNSLNEFQVKNKNLVDLNNHLSNINNNQIDEIIKLKEQNNNLVELVKSLSNVNNDFNIIIHNQFNELEYLKCIILNINEKLQVYKSICSIKSFELSQEKMKNKFLSEHEHCLDVNNKMLQDKINNLSNDVLKAKKIILDLNVIIEEKKEELTNLNESYQNTVYRKYNLEQENYYLKNFNKIDK